MKISKVLLLEGLEIVKPGLANKEIIEQSTSFAFLKDRVVTYNDEVSISHPIIGLNLRGAVKAEELYKLLARLKQDEIVLELEDNEILLSAGKAKAGLAIQPTISLPLDEVGTIENWIEIPEDFSDLLKFVIPVCSVDMSKPVLTAVHFNGRKAVLEGSDGFRIIQYKLSKRSKVNDVLIPATSAALLVKIKPDQIAIGAGWVHFKNTKGTVISCRVFDDPYVDIEPHLNIVGKELKFPTTILQALERASVFAKKDNSMDEVVSISLAANRMNIRSESASGWYSEELNVKYSDEPIEFAITPILFRDILNKEYTCIMNEGEFKKIKFTGDGWQYMAMIRV